LFWLSFPYLQLWSESPGSLEKTVVYTTVPFPVLIQAVDDDFQIES
jgi:hypothetical protein